MELDKEMIKTIKEELKNNGMFPCDEAIIGTDMYQYFLDKSIVHIIDFVSGDKQQRIFLRPDKEWDTDKIQKQLNEIFVKGEGK